MEIYPKKKRYFAVDIAVFLGALLMIGLHFFEKSGFEQQPLTGLVSLLPLALRWLCMAGVPLIVMANGAAFSRDTFSFSQYKGFGKLLYITVVCFVTVWFYSGGHPDSFPESSIKPFYYFDGCDFALMYAVLLLLSPFLNCAYQALPNMKSKTVLVAALTFLATMPNMLIFGGKFLLPVELTQLWPVTYYFIGAYVWENRKKLDAASGAVLLLTVCFSQAILSYADSLSSDMYNFDSKRLNQYSSANVAATAAVIFMIICNFRTKSKLFRGSAKAVAKITLPVLLISWIFEDNILRLLMGDKQYGDIEVMKYFVPFLLLASAASYIAAAIITAPFTAVSALFTGKKNRISDNAEQAEEPEAEEEYSAPSNDDDEEYEEAAESDTDEDSYVGRYERREACLPEKEEKEAAVLTERPQPAAGAYVSRKSADELSVDELLAMITKK